MTASSVKSRSRRSKISAKPVALLSRSKLGKRPSSTSRPLYAQLDGYQKEGVDFALSEKTVALLFEQGTGKTWICGGIIEELVARHPDFAGLMVVSLQNLESTWVKFFAAQLPQVTICRDWDAFKVAPAPKLLLMHYEALKRKGLVEKIRRKPLTFIGYDESQRLKNRASQDSRTAAKLRACGDYRVILTGTPMDENPSEMWAQFRFMNCELLGTVWNDFMDRFFEPLNPKLKARLGKAKPGTFRWQMVMRQIGMANGKREFDLDKLDEFLDLVGPYCMRVTKEVLNLPPMKLHRVPIRMFGEQRRLYEDVARDMVARIGNTSARITTPMRVTQLGRLHQICGGYVPDDDLNVHEVGRAKIRRLLAMVDGLRKPLVVFCKYVQEIWEIERELKERGYEVATITGRTPKKQRPAIIEQFQRGKIDILVAQERTGGVGIDLYKATVALFYSMTYSRVDFDQALARLHRRGQEFRVDVYLLFISGTVDEDVYEAILKKHRLTSRVLIELQNQRNRRSHHGKDRYQAGTRR